MKYFYLILLFLSLQFCACESKNEREKVLDNYIPESKNQTKKQTIDTSVSICADKFNITNEMITQQRNQKAELPYLQSGQTLSLDCVWFRNEELKQVLALELATDNYRYKSYVFYQNNYPKDLIDEISLATLNRCRQSLPQKTKDFKGFVLQSQIIPPEYFETENGFALGDSKQKAISKYGNPTKKTKFEKGIEKLEWAFRGENEVGMEEGKNTKPIIKNSYGHQVIMYFQENRLMALIFVNEMP